jgi:2-polyprenyl-3-methyl-5-hydroxy-6-metoxy-1,4-benzoquinol methylase
MASNFRPLHDRKNISIEKCESCGLEIQQPQPSDARLSQIYGADYFIDFPDDPTFMNRVTALKRGTAALQLRDLTEYIQARGLRLADSRFLEVGPGHGYMLLEAKKQGFQIRGLEYSEHATAVANKNLDGNYVSTGTLETAPDEFRNFDVIAFCDVIEHVRDPRKFLLQAYQRLKPGGVILIATINTRSISARAMRSFWMEYKPEHLFYFDDRNIVQILRSVGFADPVVTPGRKSLSWDYIAGHFIKFPVPVVTEIAKLSLSVLPNKVIQKKFEIIPSGFNAIATRA